MSSNFPIAHEAERILKVREYSILDSPREEIFDLIAELAGSLCKTPISSISFFDCNRQWIKASTGLDLTEIQKEGSFCTYTIQTAHAFVVPDANADPRFRNNSLVIQPPHIRSYAGVPLISAEGYAIGALSVLDRTPRLFSQDEIKTLNILAKIIIEQLEKRKLNQLLEEQQVKMKNTFSLSALGKMAAGIAHEINNPLSIISGTLQILKKRILSNNFEQNDFLKRIETMENTVRRMTTIARNLRSLSRGQNGESYTTVDLVSLISDSIELCKGRLQKSDIQIIQNFPDHPMEITTRPIQISQVLLNLLNNACDAIEKFEKRWISIAISDEGDFAKIVIQDSGHGIPFDLQKKIMQPFFSTKSEQGTGLGLSISKEIIEGNAGFLALEPTTEHTTFAIKLPKNLAAPR